MSTQNDWEILFFRIFNQDRFPTLKGNYNDYIKFKADTTKIIEDFSTTLLADARKEVIGKVGGMKTDKMLKSYWSESVTSSSYAGGYLQAIDDVLATLKEEQV